MEVNQPVVLHPVIVKKPRSTSHSFIHGRLLLDTVDWYGKGLALRSRFAGATVVTRKDEISEVSSPRRRILE